MDELGELIPPRREERPKWKRVLYLILGLVLVVGGIIGQLLPIIPGIPLSIAGLILLALTSERVRRAVNAGDRKLKPKTRRRLRSMLQKIPLASIHRTAE